VENSLQNGAIKKVFWEILIIVPHILKLDQFAEMLI
jgi:hypothetical protein